MDSSFPNKRPYDHSAGDRSDSHLTPSSSSKRRHQHHHHHPPPSSPATPQSNFNNPFRTPLKLSSGETLFRILCPASKTGGLIGKGGAIIRQFREETGAKIRIDESIPGSDERVIYIVAADSNPNPNPKNKDAAAVNNNNDDSNSEESGNSNCEESPAQKALLKVFERILKVDEERSKMSKEENEISEDNSPEGGSGGGGGGGGIPQGPVVCRLLAGSHQIGCVLGRGGKIIEKIRQESGAQVRVLPKDQLPECASPGDELIQMAGKFISVRKAVLSVSSCLQEAGNLGSNRPMGMPPHVYSGDHHHHHRMGMEEEVVFRLLCQVDKIGSLIGKGGSIRRAMQAETGASIKIADSASDSDDRVVVISARETLEQRHSPAQDAVIRVQSRIAEIGSESGAASVARLLVHSRQIGYLWGKGGMIISDLRRITGASIHVFPKEQVAKYGMPSDEVVQVIGNLQCIQDALFQITGRIRETFFPVKPYFSNNYMGPYPDMPPPSFRPRHDLVSEHFEPPQPPFLHDVHPNYSYPYGNERSGYGPSINRQSSSLSGSNRFAGEIAEFEGSLTKVNDPAGRNEIGTVEIVVPHSLLGFVHGENKSNIGHIEEISSAKVEVMEGGRVVLTGTWDEAQTAQCLLHAFIISEQTTRVS